MAASEKCLRKAPPLDLGLPRPESSSHGVAVIIYVQAGLGITSIFCDVDAEETQDRWQCCLVLFFSARKIVLKHISYVIKRNCMHFHIRSVQSCWDNKCSLQVLFSGSMVTYFDFRCRVPELSDFIYYFSVQSIGSKPYFEVLTV